MSWIAIGATAWGQGMPPWQVAAGGKMAFDVASVKPGKPGAFTRPSFPLDTGDAYAPTGGRFFADFPLPAYIRFAYKLSVTAEQMQSLTDHLPKWVAADPFVIEARAEGNPTKDQMRLMMQSLLADRFRLAVRFETQQVPLFELAMVKPGKLGPKLRLHADGPPCDATATDPDVFPERCELVALFLTPNQTLRAGIAEHHHGSGCRRSSLAGTPGPASRESNRPHGEI